MNKKKDEENKKKEKEPEFDFEFYKNIEENLLYRMAKNYVNMLLSIENEVDNKAFFKKYFNIIS
jgi:hypothetical protein